MKQRFSSLDIKVIAHELSKALLSLRVVNVYDLSSRIFLFKFAKPDHRQQLLLDSGFRTHLTSFSRTAASSPSTFVSRLRKYLKTRRVTAIKQVGTDRILEFQFSEGSYRLFLEFYAGGNVVLTDKDLNILALLRTVTEGAEHEHVRPGGVYNLSERQNVNGIPPLTEERIKQGLQAFVDRQAKFEQQGQQSKGRLKKKSGDELRKALLSGFPEFSPMLLDHSLRTVNVDITVAPDVALKDPGLLAKIMEALQDASKMIDTVMSSETTKGYIVGKPKQKSAGSDVKDFDASNVLYNEFHPFKPVHIAEDSANAIIEFDTFNHTVDEFFSSIEGQKLESRLQEKEVAAQKKMDFARQDQQKRIDGLQQVQELNVRKAQAIEANLERVEEAVVAINGLIAQGKDWVEISRLIELEQKRRNPVAEMIKLPLKLNENTATLLLGEWEVEEDEEADETDSEVSGSESDEEPTRPVKKPFAKPEDKRLAIDIDLSLSGWSNAREYYDQKKTAAEKEQKTVQASEKALKNAQRKIDADLKKSLKDEKSVLRPTRQPFWFEKFIYFLSSDGYLVIGGKDPQQIERIHKRYLKPGDVWVHADLAGAIPFLIKNRPQNINDPIPPSTLSQAGTMCVATSSAWDSKAIMPAWWVPAESVKKVAPTGDFLGPGNFHIKGNKSFLPPAQLLLGFTVLFQISEDSKAQHFKHRLPTSSSTDNKDIPGEREAISAADMGDVEAAKEHGDDSVADQTDDGEEQHQDADDAPRSNPLQTSGDHDSDDDGAISEEEQVSTSLAETSLEEQKTEEASNDIKDDEADRDGEEDDEEDAETASQAPTTASTNPASQATKQVRGKKGKRKKIAQKYANQDEDDRAAAMELLGSRIGQERAAAEAAAKRAREEETAKAKERRRQQALQAQEKARRREEASASVDAAAAAGGGDDDEDDTQLASVDLDTLVGRLLPGDTIVDALPMCAPWAGLGRFKYKAKLQPGSVKKGKAVREILGRWTSAGIPKRFVDERELDPERVWPREIEVIKGWREESAFGVLPVGKVRVMMPGAGGSGGGGGGGKGGGKGGSRGGRGKK